jgi:glycosyltransferase involved in cell wall biosynthesis
MIVTYHKVDCTNKTPWYVSAAEFNRQMAELSSKTVVFLDDYDPTNPNHACITFDGVYEDLLSFALPILRKFNYPFELFIVGDYVGRWNDFDQKVEPPALFATIDALRALVDGGGRLQWHTRTHTDLSKLEKPELEKELTVNSGLLETFQGNHFKWFAYPHGRVDQRVKSEVRSRFKGALACDEGDSGDLYNLPRILCYESTRLRKASVSVIIANYNYGHLLPEAIDSVLHQSVAPDEIIVSDDCSSDESKGIIEYYHSKFPARIKANFNQVNLGIVDHFNKVVDQASGDFVVILGADNRMRRDYIEKTLPVFESSPETAVVYTDMLIFGSRAHSLAAKVGAQSSLVGDAYFWRFPEPTDENLAGLKEKNFIHGSSIFRKDAFRQVGGYRKTGGPEDHDLFYRIYKLGSKFVHSPFPLIEYRQHSKDQANSKLENEIYLSFYRKKFSECNARLLIAEEKLSRASNFFAVHTQGQQVRTLVFNLLGPFRGEVWKWLILAIKCKILRRSTPKPPSSWVSSTRLLD